MSLGILRPAKAIYVPSGLRWRYAAALSTGMPLPVSAQTEQKPPEVSGPVVRPPVTPQLRQDNLKDLANRNPAPQWRPGEPVKVIEDMKERLQPGGRRERSEKGGRATPRYAGRSARRDPVAAAASGSADRADASRHTRPAADRRGIPCAGRDRLARHGCAAARPGQLRRHSGDRLSATRHRRRRGSKALHPAGKHRPRNLRQIGQPARRPDADQRALGRVRGRLRKAEQRRPDRPI